MDVQSCPRRMHEMGPWSRDEGQDTWSEAPRRPGEVVPFCSFCGSLHPGKFLELVAQGWTVEPTDKNYKAYLSQSASMRDQAAPGQALPSADAYRRSKFYYQHLSDAQQQQFVDLYNRGSMRLAVPGHFYVLPFFMRIAPHGPE